MSSSGCLEMRPGDRPEHQVHLFLKNPNISASILFLESREVVFTDERMFERMFVKEHYAYDN